MTPALAIPRNRDALVRLLVMVFAMTGISASGGVVGQVRRAVRSAAHRLLRPAEAALRRLIIMSAEKLKLKARKGAGLPFPAGLLKRTGARDPVFCLLDPIQHVAGERPVRRYAKVAPRITLIGWDDDPVFEPPRAAAMPDDLVDAQRLRRRMLAMQAALDDLPKQARRFARLLAGWNADKARRSKRAGPIRLGRPPGYRKRGQGEIDEVLGDCHIFAREVLKARDPP